jgi:hypothetical protein
MTAGVAVWPKMSPDFRKNATKVPLQMTQMKKDRIVQFFPPMTAPSEGIYFVFSILSQNSIYRPRGLAPDEDCRSRRPVKMEDQGGALLLEPLGLGEKNQVIRTPATEASIGHGARFFLISRSRRLLHN